MLNNARILVTGAGGIAGVNFVRALRASEMGYRIVGTDHNRYYIHLSDLDSRYLTPRHDDLSFIPTICMIIKSENIDFLHPQPSSEAYVISKGRDQVPTRIFLPEHSVIEIAQDKLLTQRMLETRGIPVARTKKLDSISDIDEAFNELGPPLWVRARHGAGGRLSLLCNNKDEAIAWVSLWTKKGTNIDEFIIQEYLPGRNIAWDSIWKDGRLITSYCRERLDYPLKHISPSGITGTPSVARTISDKDVNLVAKRAVKALSDKADGAYSIDVKEDSSGRPCITEVDAGKFHSTMPLWGYIAYKHLGLPWYSNLADLYVRIGLGDDIPSDVPSEDLIPAGYYMIRNIDSGVIIWREDGWKVRVI